MTHNPAETEDKTANTPRVSKEQPNGDLNSNFLEMFLDLKTQMLNINKVIEAQGLTLQNLMKPPAQQYHPAQVLPKAVAPMNPAWAWTGMGVQ